MTARTLIAFIIVLGLLPASSAFGQLDVRWASVDCGGGTSSGGAFSIQSVIAQPDAASGSLTGGTFALQGGYFGGVTICLADATHNGVVNIDDLVLVITNWNWTGSPGANPADVNGTGSVNIDDLVQVITHWGACP